MVILFVPLDRLYMWFQCVLAQQCACLGIVQHAEEQRPAAV